MKKQAICEECSYIYPQDFSEIRINKARRDKYVLYRILLLQKAKETLQNITKLKKRSHALNIQNQAIISEIQILKKSIAFSKTKEISLRNSQKNKYAEENYQEILASTATIEQKLVQIKLNYANESEKIDEIKDILLDAQSNINFKDAEIKKLNTEIERISKNIEEQSDALKPPRSSLGASRIPIMLLRKKT